jgi:adenylyl-sulfate kinase
MSDFPILWFFGLPSSGKTTLTRALRDHLKNEGHSVAVLDGDEFRRGLCADLGFSDEDRAENLRRAAEMAKLLAGQGFIVLCAFITPGEHHRDQVRQILGANLRLIHVDCPLDACVARDVKGLYQKAARKAMTGMTGTQESFAPPQQFDLALDTHGLDVQDCLDLILNSPRIHALKA